MLNTNTASTALIVAILVTYIPSLAHAHGRLINPPSRMSAWRFNFDVPRNYNDHQQYCGGFQNQWVVNGGKCGICGDPWQGPRKYERPNGSMVRKLVITKTYNEGETIDVNVEVTVNHLGWFEFRLCDVRQSGGVEATQACLDRHVMADRRGKTRFDIGTKKGMIHFKLVLPPGLSCPQCVMQWKWHCGNNVGYGDKQEEFYACSDVTIKSSGSPGVTLPPITRPPITRPPVTRPPVTRLPITRFPITRFPITRPPITGFPITRPPITQFPITRFPVTRPPVRPYTPITDPPRVTLPPYLLVILGDKRRTLAERIKIYAQYQQSHIDGYNIWDETKVSFKQRYDPRKDMAIQRLRNDNNKNTYNNNNNNNNYNNNYNNNNNNNNNVNNARFCILCRNGCRFHDCPRLCPSDCPIIIG